MPETTVPHLTTALTGPLREIESHLLAQQVTIEQWFRAQWLSTPPPFYCSVDLRNAGFKLAPVDTNLFPAGFNNLNPAFRPLCVQAVQAGVERICPHARGVVVVPENHTRNTFYYESLGALIEILEAAGLKVRLGSLLGETGAREIELVGGRRHLVEPLARRGDKVHVGDYEPCWVLLNNDLSAGRPPMLEGIKQTVAPPLALGWRNRLKSQHFTQYREIAREFAQLVRVDPWLIDPVFRNCGKIDFRNRSGEECLSLNVERVLTDVREKYREYGIDQEPFVIIKADAGTYGMAIMTVKGPEEVKDLNRKQRNKMAKVKEGQPVTDVLVQEGIYTFESWGSENAVAEPVVYMIDRFVVGGFYRVHTARGRDENLNAPGMHFEPLAFAEPCTFPVPHLAPDANPNRFYAYGVIARLALLAAARELKAAHAQSPPAMAEVS